MDNSQERRKSFSLNREPPKLFRTTGRKSRATVEVFQPYEENLPLEAGFYTFVLDQNGQFRIKRGNFSSHASFVGRAPIGAAGNFRVNRSGNVAEVFCLSQDYNLFVADYLDSTVGYVIDSFLFHHALDTSLLAIFRFRNEPYTSFHVSIERTPITDLENRLRRLEVEGKGNEKRPRFSEFETEKFRRYTPTPPIRLYGMHRDQFDPDDSLEFEIGPSKPRFSPEGDRLASGKWAFVIDQEGWLFVGNGHHILSGGAQVGAAGQIIVEASGVIGEIDLNFSGHYRPPLDADYARYAYRAIAGHPLLTLSPECWIWGRKFEGLDLYSPRLKFSVEELTSDDPMLDLLFESA